MGRLSLESAGGGADKTDAEQGSMEEDMRLRKPIVTCTQNHQAPKEVTCMKMSESTRQAKKQRSVACYSWKNQLKQGDVTQVTVLTDRIWRSSS